jgi:predicted P-loop ATPase
MNQTKGRKRADEPAWSKKVQVVRDDRGRMVACVANAIAALRNDPDLSGLVAYNASEREAMLMRPVGAGGDGFPRQVQDHDATEIQEHLQLSGMPRIGRDSIFHAIELVARDQQYHPLRDYLTGIAWDGKARLDEWLTYYMGARASDYGHEIGLMFMVAMVRRALEPGCQSDYMLILEGDQGDQKSTACRVLGGDYFGDHMPGLSFGTERASQYVKNKWLVEIGELSAFKRADVDLLKSFLTRRTEDYHAPYGRKNVVEPRQCVFVGTTNKEVYLDDPTGARRFWPIKTGRIRLDELMADRDQLFAEAVVYHRQGFQAYPDRDFEAKYIKPQREARRLIDPWQDQVAAYVAQRAKVFVGEIAREALGLGNERLTRSVSNRIGEIMAGLPGGWSRSDKKIDGYNPWIRPDSLGLRVIEGGRSA